MEQIQQNQFINYINSIGLELDAKIEQATIEGKAPKGAVPMTITTLTPERVRKTGNPHPEVYKLTTVNGMMGIDYQNMVNRQREKEKIEPNFQAQERKWGEKLSKVLTYHEGKDKYYLNFAPFKVIKGPQYFVPNDEGGLTEISKQIIEPFLPTKTAPSTTQGTEKEIVYRTYSIENILVANINKRRFLITDGVAANWDNLIEIARIETETAVQEVFKTIMDYVDY